MRPQTSRLDLQPTPDSGQRLSGERVWDEDGRPVRGEPDEDVAYSAQGRAFAKSLLTVHGELRTQLTAIRRVIDGLETGTATYSGARSALNQVAVRQQRWTAGAGCASYCSFVTAHHFGEDFEVFPALRRREASLDAVLDRLTAEHDVIHEIVERVDRDLVSLMAGTSTIATLRATIDVLSDALLSHLAYEEAQLLEPFARYLG